MRILLVEDAASIRKPVVRALKASGFAVDSTGDGVEGWQMAQDHDYDVIILDIMLPGMDGLEILRRLRTSGNETPVLFLTAKDAIEDRVAGLRLGADDYLTKSFAVEELLARVDALGRRKYAKRSPLLVAGDLELDQAAKKVRRAGRELNLTPQLFSLLEYLLLRKGHVVSRTEIEEHIYDELASPMSNVVDTAVCALRRAIALSDESEPIIHTRRGMGYVIPESP
ncbi:response regulator transcription factor [Phragmitibacter flavus]|uniref:Response regulator transcription factor n=1 Tax=Phragmitibacter flavus TaxID=2576071 RepID=A0A5R8KF70_9BACT|nr:response regulator transcription factor [Phragmitibacter flavus]TLD70946.1 response regulator transcription factor [Phragmitibacter flavus]